MSGLVVCNKPLKEQVSSESTTGNMLLGIRRCWILFMNHGKASLWRFMIILVLLDNAHFVVNLRYHGGK